jgi:hypothetical protein
MRTQDPTNIRNDFDASITDIATAFQAAEAGVQDEAAKKLIAEYLFVAAATLFEGFVSDLFVAYINRDSTRFREHLLGKMLLKTDDELAKRSVVHVEKTMPHLSVDKIRQILDPTGYNVTFATPAALSSWRRSSPTSPGCGRSDRRAWSAVFGLESCPHLADR